MAISVQSPRDAKFQLPLPVAVLVLAALAYYDPNAENVGFGGDIVRNSVECGGHTYSVSHEYIGDQAYIVLVRGSDVNNDVKTHEHYRAVFPVGQEPRLMIKTSGVETQAQDEPRFKRFAPNKVNFEL